LREGSSDEWVSGRWQAADVLRALSMSSISASLADGISGAAVGKLDRRQWRRGERRGGCRRRCCWIRYAGWLRGLVVVEGGIGIGRLLLRCSVSGSPRPPPAPSRAPLRRQGPTLTTAEAARTEILTRATRRPR
jgi:hypothetical protein